MGTSRKSASAARIVVVLLGGALGYLVLVSLTLIAFLGQPDYFIKLVPEQYEPLHRAVHVHAIGLFVVGAGFLAARRIQRCGTMVPKVVLLCLSILGVCSLDLIVGVFVPSPLPTLSIFDRHPERGWTIARNFNVGPRQVDHVTASVRTDENGLRVSAANPNQAKAQGFRILFLGDSVTFGGNSPSELTYVAQTGMALTRKNESLSPVALNAGVLGYDTWQEWHYLVHDGLGLNPDLVVLQFCLNDVTAQFGPGGTRAMQNHPNTVQAMTSTHWSGLCRAVTALIGRWQYEDPNKAWREIEHFEYQELLNSPDNRRVKTAWQRTFEDLRRIVKVCREEGLPLVLVCFPIKEQLKSTEASVVPQQRLKRFADAEGVPYLDLHPLYLSFQQREGKTPDDLMTDSTHPTILGNRLAGEAVAVFLVESGLVPSAANDR